MFRVLSKMATSEEYKLLVVGDRKAGKSELISQFIQGKRITAAVKDYYQKQCVIDDKVVVLDILDTSGHETFSAMSDMFIRAQQGYLLVYSIMDMDSFQGIPLYYEKILQVKEMTDVPMVLVANEPHEKETEEEERVVSAAQGRALASVLRVKYIETSVKYNVNVSRAFHDLARLIGEAQNRTVEFSVKNVLKAALQDGFIPHTDDKFLIHGPGGAGKSSLIAMFLGKQRDLVRISTPVANQSLHLCPVRDVSTTTYTPDWEEVDYNRLSRMIAHTSHQMCQRWAKKENVAHANKEPPVKTSDDSPQQEAYLASSRYLESSIRAKFSLMIGRLRSGMSNLFKKTLANTLDDDPYNIEGFFTKFQEGLRELVVPLGGFGMQEVIVSHSIRIIDSGGQPQFHDLLSIFIPELSGLVSVFKLSEPLAFHGEVAFYKEGKLTCTAYESHYTNEQVIRHDLQVIQSEAARSGVDRIPNLVFVGTHHDVYPSSSCSESPDEKDELLNSIITEILPPEIQQSVITAGSTLSNVTFKINAREPEKSDFKKVEQLKYLLLSRSRAKSRDLPLKWYGYEVALHLLMQELGRQCLSRRECEFIAHKLGFDVASFVAALEYLRQLNIISFFNALPGVIFGSSQVILDKITELVTYHLELKDDTVAMTGPQRKFLHQGIVSLEILQTPQLSKHYSGGLFEPNHLLDVLKSKLVVTKVGENEFMMPCVMEVNDIYPSQLLPEGQVQSSFVLHFSKKSPMLGMYCCTVAYLLSNTDWKLLTENGNIVQVARNSVTFEVPENVPGKLTFLDPLSSYFEVILEIPQIIAGKPSAQLYRNIRDTLITAMEQAMHNLNYEVKTPELSFLCPEKSSRCSTFPHIAKLDKLHQLLTCSKFPAKVYQSLSLDQKMWLQNESDQQYNTEIFLAQSNSSGWEPLAHAGADETHGTSSPLVSIQSTKSDANAKATQLINGSYELPQQVDNHPTTQQETGNSTYRPQQSYAAMKKKKEAAPLLTISGEKPTLPELLKIKLPSRVGPKLQTFSTLLLQDKFGDIVSNIIEDCRGKTESVIIEVLREWLAGKGVEVSWESLIATLRECELPLMAKQIQMALEIKNPPC